MRGRVGIRRISRRAPTQTNTAATGTRPTVSPRRRWTPGRAGRSCRPSKACGWENVRRASLRFGTGAPNGFDEPRTTAIRDRRGRFVDGLTWDDFAIFENDVRRRQVGVDHPDQPLGVVPLVRQARRLCRRHARGRVAPAPVVPDVEQRDGVRVVHQLLAERVGQPREPPHAHPNVQVLPLDVAGRDVLRVRVAGDRFRLRPEALRRAVARLRLLGSVELDELREVHIGPEHVLDSRQVRPVPI